MSNNSNYLGKKKPKKKTVCVENDQSSSENTKKKWGILEHKNLRVIKPNKTIRKKQCCYRCIICAFETRNLKDYKRHKNTKKHKKKTLKNPKNNDTITKKIHMCICGKEYKYAPGLSNHKKKCEMLKNILKKTEKNEQFKFEKKKVKNCQKVNKSSIGKVDFWPKSTIFEKNEENTLLVTKPFQHSNDSNDISSNFLHTRESDGYYKLLETMKHGEIIEKLLKQNTMLIENLSKKSTNNITYQNCGNKKMTVNVFLNEKCNNAMNLSDFVNNLNISIEDLLYTQQNGYIKGITNIFEKHLNVLLPSQRPIHCSDKKRKQFYVRDENKWQKDEKNEKIDKTIHDLTIKQIKHLKEWETQNPNYLQNEKLLTQWQELVHEIMGPSDDSTREKDKETIIKKLTNTVELKDNLIITKN